MGWDGRVGWMGLVDWLLCGRGRKGRKEGRKKGRMSVD